MYQYDRYEQPAPPAQSGAYLTAEELRQITELIRELKDATLSRSSFKAASAFLARFGGDSDISTLVTPS